jgi:hypothetical protein
MGGLIRIYYGTEAELGKGSHFYKVPEKKHFKPRLLMTASGALFCGQ